jgi:hypothetical protein
MKQTEVRCEDTPNQSPDTACIDSERRLKPPGLAGGFFIVARCDNGDCARLYRNIFLSKNPPRVRLAE